MLPTLQAAIPSAGGSPAQQPGPLRLHAHSGGMPRGARTRTGRAVARGRARALKSPRPLPPYLRAIL